VQVAKTGEQRDGATGRVRFHRLIWRPRSRRHW
jgi:hypothetical protein